MARSCISNTNVFIFKDMVATSICPSVGLSDHLSITASSSSCQLCLMRLFLSQTMKRIYPLSIHSHLLRFSDSVRHRQRHRHRHRQRPRHRHRHRHRNRHRQRHRRIIFMSFKIEFSYLFQVEYSNCLFESLIFSFH